LGLKDDIKKICGGQDHSVLLTKDGKVYTWGRNQYGQLGLETDQEVVNEPQRVNIEKVVDVSCGANHTIFLTKEGSIYACGLPSMDRFPSREEKVNRPTLIFEGIDKYKLLGISSGKRHNLIVAEENK